MKTFLWIAAIVFATVCGVGVVKISASENNSQLFTPARFSLVAADVDVAMLQGGGGDDSGRNVVFKLDSVTGEVWVLQLSVVGGNNPQVTGASWYPVQTAPANTNSGSGTPPMPGM